MSQEQGIDELVHRHGRAIVSMDIPRIMDDLTPETLAKLQQQAGGGTAMQIDSYEILSSQADGPDYLYDVKYVGPQSFTVRARWSRVGSDWRVVDADVIARE
jgi:hypothetical protein